MTTIGVYDSGIGGLTTLLQLEKHFPFCNFYYLADNKNMPFGNKSVQELETIVSEGLKKLKAHSDLQVFACNTTSTVPSSALKLVPPTVDGKTLVMATPRTIEVLKQKPEFQTEQVQFASTDELASLVEVLASVSVRKNCLNMQDAIPYLAKHLFKFKGVQNVVLGCSHYLFLKHEISSILGTVKFYDGNQTLIEEVGKTLADEPKSANFQPKVEFGFTSFDETAKYQKIFSLLKSSQV